MNFVMKYFLCLFLTRLAESQAKKRIEMIELSARENRVNGSSSGLVLVFILWIKGFEETGLLLNGNVHLQYCFQIIQIRNTIHSDK